MQFTELYNVSSLYKQNLKEMLLWRPFIFLLHTRWQWINNQHVQTKKIFFSINHFHIIREDSKTLCSRREGESITHFSCSYSGSCTKQMIVQFLSGSSVCQTHLLGWSQMIWASEPDAMISLQSNMKAGSDLPLV